MVFPNYIYKHQSAAMQPELKMKLFACCVSIEEKAKLNPEIASILKHIAKAKEESDNESGAK